MKPYHLLIPVVAICLLLTAAHDSRSAIEEQPLDLAPIHVQAQPDAPLIPMYIRFHPRFYKEYGATGWSSTLYVQNSGQGWGTYVLEFRDCVSGTFVYLSDWTIPPGVTRVAGPGDFPDLPPGCYSLIITSDTYLAHASLVEDTWNGGSAADTLATYPGFAEEEAASELRFGPLLKGDVNSTVHIWNASYYASVTLTANAYDASGVKIVLPSCALAPYAQCSYNASTLAQLPPSFVGTLVIQATGRSIMGLMDLDSPSGDTSEYRKPLAPGATSVCLPRALRHVNEGGMTCSTTVFVANTANQASNVDLAFYGQTGAPATLYYSFSLAANGSRYLRLVDLAQLGDGIWSVCASGTQPVTLEELTQAESPSPAPASSATHGGSKLGTSVFPDPTHLALTHLMRSDESYTAFSLQNPGGTTASVELKYYDLDGALIHTDSVDLPPKGWARFNQSTQPELGNGYVGSPVVSSSQALIALVDTYVPPTPKRVFLPLVLR